MVYIHSLRPAQPSYKTQKHQPSLGFGRAVPADPLQTLAKRYAVIDRMLKMIQIPSSTPQAGAKHQSTIDKELERMKVFVIGEFNRMGVTQIERHPLGGLIVRIPGTGFLSNRQPILLTAHMDIVPWDPQNPTKPVKPKFLKANGREFIASDGTTTLGADDKAGLSMIMEVVNRIKDKPHVPIEILLSPDEESSCDSLRMLTGQEFKAQKVIVVDEFKPFQATTGLASATVVNLSVQGTYGGHSGDDIHRSNRLNAAMVMGEMTRKMGTGVVKWVPNHIGTLPLISKNLGMMQAGTAPNSIPIEAKATYMLRSFDQKAEDRELKRMGRIKDQTANKYRHSQPKEFDVRMEVEKAYPAWDNPHSSLISVLKTAAKQIKGPKVQVGATHAAAQASIIATKRNAFGQLFDAVLIGPYIESAHHKDERVDWKSIVQGTEWLEKIVLSLR